MLVFLQSIKSEKTQKCYIGNLGFFLRFAREKRLASDYESLLGISQEQGQILLEDYLFYQKKNGFTLSTINIRFASLKLFFSMNDKIFNWDKIHKMFPEPSKRGNNKPHTNETISKMLERIHVIDKKALLLALASSGCRVGMVEYFRLKDMKPMPNGCRSITVYAGTKDEYVTFITKEASEYLDRWLEQRQRNGERLNDYSLVFDEKQQSYSSYFSRLCKDNELCGQKSNNRHEIASLHGLRKRFNTILKSRNDVNPNIAERLMGHSLTIQLDNAYFVPTMDRLFEEYQKVILDLTIDEKYQVLNELELKNQHIQKLENDKDQKIKELEQKLEMISHHLKNLGLNH
jgi:integrase